MVLHLKFIVIQVLRAPIIALRAFDVETKLVSDHAKSEMLMMMRFQWWRDAVNSTFQGKPPDHPVMRALAGVFVEQGVQLTRYRLQKIISTREEMMLAQQPPPSLKQLEEKAEGTISQLLYLQLEAYQGFKAFAGDERDMVGEDVREATSHIGRAVGLATLLRGTRFYASRQQTYLPVDLCDHHGIEPGDLINDQNCLSDGVRLVVRDIVDRAQEHLRQGRVQRSTKKLPRDVSTLLLPSLAADLYLRALSSRANYNVYDDTLSRGGGSLLGYQLRVKINVLLGKY